MKLDEVAIQILQKYQPVLLDTVVPLSVKGDGNCMCRASSLGVFGVFAVTTSVRHISLMPCWIFMKQKPKCAF